MSIIFEMKKGIKNGPATISINDQRVCKTNFSDQIEFINSSRHPIGKRNTITKDRAILNCLLVLATVICFIMIVATPDVAYLWIILGLIFYLAQIVEVMTSQTLILLSKAQTAWDDLESFKNLFFQLKKCRPVVNFTYMAN